MEISDERLARFEPRFEPRLKKEVTNFKQGYRKRRSKEQDASTRKHANHVRS